MPALICLIFILLSLFACFVDLVINGGLIAEDLCKSLDIVTAPALIHFAVAAELAAHQIMGAFDAGDRIAVRLNGYENLAGDRSLGIFQELFDVPHGGVQHLSFM